MMARFRAPPQLRRFTSYVYQLEKHGQLVWERETVFVGEIAEAGVAGLTLMEGCDLALWALDDLLRQPRIVPHQVASLMMFERLGADFGFPPR